MRAYRNKKHRGKKIAIIFIFIAALVYTLFNGGADILKGSFVSLGSDSNMAVYTDDNVIPVKDENRRDLLVNKHNKLRDGYEPYSLVTSLSGILVTPETDKALNEMADDAATEGLNLQACSGYRSFEKQESLYNQYVEDYGQDYADRYSARPGYSEHHTGRAIDLISPQGIMDDFESTPECTWVHENAYKYGFIL